LIYNNSCNYIENVKLTNCENCEVLQEKVKYLIKKISKSSMGMTNLNSLLDSHNCVFKKAGTSFQDGFKKKVKTFKFFKS